MRHLNPTLYEVIQEWANDLPIDYEVQREGNTRDNLHNSKEKIVACLIEQFPMSYRQSYEVYSDLFNQSEIFSVYHSLDTINVLAMATGSGGDVFGLIHAFEKYFKGKTIHIFSVEGNEDALQSQTNLFKRYIEGNLIANKVQLVPIPAVIQPGLRGLKEELKDRCFTPYGVEKFDLMHGFKWMNEKSIRGWFHPYHFYAFFNYHLLPDRVAVWLETVDLKSQYQGDRSLSQRAIFDYVKYCHHFQEKNHLMALTPTPCIARHLSGKLKQCEGCLGCFDEIDTYVKSMDERANRWQGQSIFVMKFASGPLGRELSKYLQDEHVGYQTAFFNGQPHFCTLNSTKEMKKVANAFVLGNLSKQES